MTTTAPEPDWADADGFYIGPGACFFEDYRTRYWHYYEPKAAEDTPATATPPVANRTTP